MKWNGRYALYGLFLLSIFGSYAYLTFVAVVPQPIALQLTPGATHLKINKFNAEMQQAHDWAQTTRQNQQVNLVLSDADMTVMLNEKETAQSNPLDVWVVHARSDGQVSVWGTKTTMNNVLHHTYWMVFRYNLGTFQNRAAAEVVGINFSGLVLPDKIVSSIAKTVEPPTFESPPTTLIAVKASEGQLQVSVTWLGLTG